MTTQRKVLVFVWACLYIGGAHCVVKQFCKDEYVYIRENNANTYTQGIGIIRFDFIGDGSNSATCNSTTMKFDFPKTNHTCRLNRTVVDAVFAHISYQQTTNFSTAEFLCDNFDAFKLEFDWVPINGLSTTYTFDDDMKELCQQISKNNLNRINILNDYSNRNKNASQADCVCYITLAENTFLHFYTYDNRSISNQTMTLDSTRPGFHYLTWNKTNNPGTQCLYFRDQTFPLHWISKTAASRGYFWISIEGRDSCNQNGASKNTMSFMCNGTQPTTPPPTTTTAASAAITTAAAKTTTTNSTRHVNGGSSTTPKTANSTEADSGVNLYVIIGILVGALLLLLVIIVVCCCKGGMCGKKRNRTGPDDPASNTVPEKILHIDEDANRDDDLVTGQSQNADVIPIANQSFRNNAAASSIPDSNSNTTTSNTENAVKESHQGLEDQGTHGLPTSSTRTGREFQQVLQEIRDEPMLLTHEIENDLSLRRHDNTLEQIDETTNQPQVNATKTVNVIPQENADESIDVRNGKENEPRPSTSNYNDMVERSEVAAEHLYTEHHKKKKKNKKKKKRMQEALDDLLGEERQDNTSNDEDEMRKKKKKRKKNKKRRRQEEEQIDALQGAGEYQVADERPYGADNTRHVADETPQGTDSTPHGADERPYGAVETPKGADETPKGANETHPGADNKQQGADETPQGADNTGQVADETLQGADETLKGTYETFQGADETHQVADNKQQGADETINDTE